MEGPFIPAKQMRGYPLPDDQGRNFQPGLYRVIQGFTDGDGTPHCVGDEWLLVYSFFVPFDSTLWLMVSLYDSLQWIIPLVWDKAWQASVLDNFSVYASRIGPLPEGFEFKIED
jgi:hypothetical protein